jgi:hypothetical protein
MLAILHQYPRLREKDAGDYRGYTNLVKKNVAV